MNYKTPLLFALGVWVAFFGGLFAGRSLTDPVPVDPNMVRLLDEIHDVHLQVADIRRLLEISRAADSADRLHLEGAPPFIIRGNVLYYDDPGLYEPTPETR